MNDPRRETVLVVDDEKANLSLIFEALHAADFRVMTAEDGDGALDIIASSPPDIALLDVNLPDMDGFELYARIKGCEGMTDLPVLFLTVMTGFDEKLQAFGMQAMEYIVKPFAPQEVVASVERHLLVHSLRRRLQTQNDRLQREISARMRVEEELKQHRDRLEELVAERTRRVRELTVHLAEAEQAERRQLARELHDQVGQNLTAISLNLMTLQYQIPPHAPDQHEIIDQVNARLTESLAMVKETTQRVSMVTDNLRPPALEEYGLFAALRWYATQFAARADIAVRVRGEEPSPRLVAATETAFFRIAQEALNNVARHAQAAAVQITVQEVRRGEVGIEESWVCMSITDDGVGFASQPAAPHDEHQPWGLLTMRERAEAVNGRYRVESTLDEGTRVIVEVNR